MSYPDPEGLAVLRENQASQEVADDEKAATEALVTYVRDNPGASPTEVMGHFFPPSPLGFTKRDLQLALVDGLYYGRITRTEGGLYVAEHSGSPIPEGSADPESTADPLWIDGEEMCGDDDCPRWDSHPPHPNPESAG